MNELHSNDMSSSTRLVGPSPEEHGQINTKCRPCRGPLHGSQLQVYGGSINCVIKDYAGETFFKWVSSNLYICKLNIVYYDVDRWEALALRMTLYWSSTTVLPPAGLPSSSPVPSHSWVAMSASTGAVSSVAVSVFVLSMCMQALQGWEGTATLLTTWLKNRWFTSS